MEVTTENWQENFTRSEDILNTTSLMTESTSEVHILDQFNSWYRKFHGHLAVCVCVFGIVSNVVNIIVLTREKMVTPINCLLSALATADMLTMASYLPYATYLYIVKEPAPLGHHSEGWVVYIIFNNLFVITCHQMAMWLTVALSIFRYIVVCHHRRGPNLCSLRRAKITIVIVLVASVVISIPNYLNYQVIDLRDDPDLNHTRFWITYSYINVQNDYILARVNFYLYVTCSRIVPCLLLVIMSSLLIRAMHAAKKRRLRLFSQTRRADDEIGAEYNRTTAMLVAVVLFSVLTYLPLGLLALVSAIVDTYHRYYLPLNEVMDMLILVNSSVNFNLYCIMSRQFRQTFMEVFHISYLTNMLCKETRNNPIEHDAEMTTL